MYLGFNMSCLVYWRFCKACSNWVTCMANQQPVECSPLTWYVREMLYKLIYYIASQAYTFLHTLSLHLAVVVFYKLQLIIAISNTGKKHLITVECIVKMKIISKRYPSLEYDAIHAKLINTTWSKLQRKNNATSRRKLREKDFLINVWLLYIDFDVHVQTTICSGNRWGAKGRQDENQTRWCRFFPLLILIEPIDVQEMSWRRIRYINSRGFISESV